MISSIFVVNKEGIPIVAKHQTPETQTGIIDQVLDLVRNCKEVPSILQNGNYRICSKGSGEVYLIAAATVEGNAMEVFSILERFETILHSYIENPLTDFGVKDSFTKVYRILDLFVDYGFPLIDELNAINVFLPDGKEQGDLNAILPWRTNGITYRSQQLLFDTTEYLDYCVSAVGRVDIQQVRGEIKSTTMLNGNPTCYISWKNNPNFDDYSFHRCVEYGDFQSTKRISLIPPHGECVIMKYRMQVPHAKIPLDVKFSFTSTDIHITLTPESELSDVTVSFFSDRGLKFNLTAGSVSFTTEECVWTLGKIKPGKNYELGGPFTNGISYIRCGFTKQGSLISECELVSICLDNSALSSYVGTRYQTKAGHFQHRITV